MLLKEKVGVLDDLLSFVKISELLLFMHFPRKIIDSKRFGMTNNLSFTSLGRRSSSRFSWTS